MNKVLLIYGFPGTGGKTLAHRLKFPRRRLPVRWRVFSNGHNHNICRFAGSSIHLDITTIIRGKLEKGYITTSPSREITNQWSKLYTTDDPAFWAKQAIHQANDQVWSIVANHGLSIKVVKNEMSLVISGLTSIDKYRYFAGIRSFTDVATARVYRNGIGVYHNLSIMHGYTTDYLLIPDNETLEQTLLDLPQYLGHVDTGILL